MAYAIIEAPSALGLSTDGVEGLAGRLLDLGLAERLGARRAARLREPARHEQIDKATGVRNAGAIAEWTPELADAITPVLERGEFPIVLGGDCTILLGSLLALRPRGSYSLLFIDGHADFFQPEAEPNGEGASMDLAWATGHGPAPLTEIGGQSPLVRSANVVAFGFRDHDDQREAGSQPLPTDMHILDLPLLREMDFRDAVQSALKHLTRADLDGFFIHLDADCLDDQLMPAVDFRLPGGLSAAEVKQLLQAALATGKAVGLEVTIYNPTLDKDGRAGRLLVDLLVDALGSAA
ncbi:MAG TPA: arginase family protein [Devosia sp.]|nr:arginase family protein [Devosia sp.]